MRMLASVGSGFHYHHAPKHDPEFGFHSTLTISWIASSLSVDHWPVWVEDNTFQRILAWTWGCGIIRSSTVLLEEEQGNNQFTLWYDSKMKFKVNPNIVLMVESRGKSRCLISKVSTLQASVVNATLRFNVCTGTLFLWVKWWWLLLLLFLDIQVLQWHVGVVNYAGCHQKLFIIILK